MAKTCMKYREMRRKFPNMVRNRLSTAADDRVGIFVDLVCAEFVSVNIALEGKIPGVTKASW